MELKLWDFAGVGVGVETSGVGVGVGVETPELNPTLPFIADLYLAWHEYCYMYKLSKSKLESDINLAKTLSNNSRYIDDISVINHLGFGSIAKEIYHPSLILEESGTGYHYDTFLDLLVRIYNQ